MPLVNEEQNILNNKIKIIQKSIEKLKVINTLSYETGSEKSEKIERYKKALDSPYFGRLDINHGDYKEIFYIGKTGIEYDNDEIVVVDWRADISQLFYSFNGGNGKITYKSGDDIFEVAVERKRNIDIEKGNVKNVREVTSSKPSIDNVKNTSVENGNNLDTLPIYDDFIYKVLSEKKNTHEISDIISTIQVEQDKVIREDISKPLIVQGVAGSGKSSIALNRISYLLYKYRDTLRSTDIMILAPNKMFIDLIKNALPQLEISTIKQSTFYDWAMEHLKEYNIKIKQPFELLGELVNEGLSDVSENIIIVSKFKGSNVFKELIDKYMQMIEENLYFNESKISVNGETFINTKPINSLLDSKKYLPLNKRLNEVIKSANNIINEEIGKVINKIQNEFDIIIKNWLSFLPEGSDERMKTFATFETIKNKKIKRLRDDFNKTKEKIHAKIKLKSPVTIYKNLFNKEILKNLKPDLSDDFIETLLSSNNKVEENLFEYEDLAPILYIHFKLYGFSETSKYIVVDEAQDLSLLELEILKNSTKSMTLLGDTTQTIYYYRSIHHWDEVKKEVYPFKDVKRINLDISYRSTFEIMALANEILKNSGTSSPLSKSILRKGEIPLIRSVNNGKELFFNLRKSIQVFRNKDFSIIGLICKDLQQAESIYEFLLRYKVESVQLVTNANEKLVEQIIVIPSYLVKGLEFDAVVIANASANRYSSTLLDAKLLYTAVTRAQHDLHIYYHGKLTPLINMK